MTTQPADPTPAPLLETAATQPVTETQAPANPPAGDPNPVIPGNATPDDAGDLPKTRKELDQWYADKQKQQPSSDSKPVEPPAAPPAAPAPKPVDPPATPPAGSGKQSKAKGSKWFAGRPEKE